MILITLFGETLDGKIIEFDILDVKEVPSRTGNFVFVYINEYDDKTVTVFADSVSCDKENLRRNKNVQEAKNANECKSCGYKPIVDVDFLKEIIELLKDPRDTSKFEYAKQMIEDWIDSLEH